jgi:hypothetical protein
MRRFTAILTTALAVVLVKPALGEPFVISKTVDVDFNRMVPNGDTGTTAFTIDSDPDSFVGPDGTTYEVNYQILISSTGGNVAGAVGVGVEGSSGGRNIDRPDESLKFALAATVTPTTPAVGSAFVTAMFDAVDFPASAKQKKDAGLITSDAGDYMLWDNDVTPLVDPCVFEPGATQFTTAWQPASRGNANSWAVRGATLTWTATVAVPEPTMLTGIVFGVCGLICVIGGVRRRV